jgi:hypothetical protein
MLAKKIVKSCFYERLNQRPSFFTRKKAAINYCFTKIHR